MSKIEWIFVRHAPAVDREVFRVKRLADKERPLTKSGKEEFFCFIRKIKKQLLKAEIILSSPALRCLETAEIIQEILSASHGSVVIEENLKDIQSIDAILRSIIKVKQKRSMIIVGHEPQLSCLVSYLLSFNENLNLFKMKKGSAICLRWNSIQEIGVAPAQMKWFVHPEVFRGLEKK